MPQFFDGCETGRAAADYDDFLWDLTGAFVALLQYGALSLLSHEYPIITLFHRPANEWIESGGAQGLACVQIEARVMPGTPNGIFHHQTVDERPAVMCAGRPDGEDLGFTSHQKHLFTPAMTNQLSAIGKVGRCNALGQIRPV